MLTAHVRTETNHKATQRALHLLALPAAAGSAAAASRHTDEAACTSGEQMHAAAVRAGNVGPSQPAAEPGAHQPGHVRAASGSGASCSDRGLAGQRGTPDSWAEVQVLQQRLADAQHPQVNSCAEHPPDVSLQTVCSRSPRGCACGEWVTSGWSCD